MPAGSPTPDQVREYAAELRRQHVAQEIARLQAEQLQIAQQQEEFRLLVAANKRRMEELNQVCMPVT